MKIILLLLTVLPTIFATASASAREFNMFQGTQKRDGLNYSISPLYGYETVYRNSPSPHITTTSLYGLRVTAGVDLLSLEAEYSKGTDNETFSTAPEQVKYEDENYKLGLLSTYRMGKYLSASARAGAQATKTKETSTSSGVATVKDDPIRYNPYGGAQISLNFGVFSVNASSTVVFRDMNNMSKNDYQNTLSFGVGY